jgi:hypothetical protein
MRQGTKGEQAKGDMAPRSRVRLSSSKGDVELLAPWLHGIMLALWHHLAFQITGRGGDARGVRGRPVMASTVRGLPVAAITVGSTRSSTGGRSYSFRRAARRPALLLRGVRATKRACPGSAGQHSVRISGPARHGHSGQAVHPTQASFESVVNRFSGSRAFALEQNGRVRWYQCIWISTQSNAARVEIRLFAFLGNQL